MESYYLYQIAALVLLIALAVFAFILPDRRRSKRLAEQVSGLRAGDEIATKNGLTGTVESVGDGTVVVSVGPDGTRLAVAIWGIKEVLS